MHRVEVCCVKKATKKNDDVKDEQLVLLLKDYLADEYTWDAFFSEYLEQGACCSEPCIHLQHTLLYTLVPDLVLIPTMILWSQLVIFIDS